MQGILGILVDGKGTLLRTLRYLSSVVRRFARETEMIHASEVSIANLENPSN